MSDENDNENDNDSSTWLEVRCPREAGGCGDAVTFTTADHDEILEQMSSTGALVMLQGCGCDGFVFEFRRGHLSDSGPVALGPDGNFRAAHDGGLHLVGGHRVPTSEPDDGDVA